MSLNNFLLWKYFKLVGCHKVNENRAIFVYKSKLLVKTWQNEI